MSKRLRDKKDASPHAKRTKVRNSEGAADGGDDPSTHDDKNSSVRECIPRTLLVTSLFTKPETGKLMKEVHEMKLTEQIGIQNDAGAKQLSPRQVLLVGSGDLRQNQLQPGELRENIVLSFEQFPDVRSKSLTAAGAPANGFGCREIEKSQQQDSCVSTREKMMLGEERGAKLCTLFASGNVVRLGETCELRITMMCEPCGHVIDYMKKQRCSSVVAEARSLGSRLKSSLGNLVSNSSSKSVQDASASETARSSTLPTVKSLDGHRGILATCLKGGIIRCGDIATVLKHNEKTYDTLPASAKDRVKWLLEKVPAGKVVRIRDMLMYIGEPIGYARALPAVVRSIVKVSDAVPVHRLVDSDRRLMTRCVDDQEGRLRLEGVQFASTDRTFVKKENSTSAPQVLLEYVWEPTHAELYLQND